MNGANALIKTLLAAGVDVCFSNPGTSEMHFVGALDAHPQMRCILGLFEGVLSGAADGYARMAGKPAATLLHLGPGLGNALANIHNARRANVAMVNIIGDHAGYHLHYDAPLTSDVAGIARPVSHWVQSARGADDIARVGAEAVAQARRAPGHVASLILPADSCWNETRHGPAALPAIAPAPRVDDSAIAAACKALAEDGAMLLVGGVVDAARLRTAAAIAERSGARLACETFPTRLARGAGLPDIARLPYIPEMAHDFLRGVRRLVLAGTRAPATFFAYPGIASDLVPAGCEVHTLAAVEQDVTDALDRLAAACGAGGIHVPGTPAARPALPEGALNGNSIATSIAALLPDDAIIIDEGIVGGVGVYGALSGAPAHDWLGQTGGAIGWGLPAAVGAAVACPQRKVLCLEGDGSAMYTIQALWTMAREKLDVTTVIFANRQYAILQLEYTRVGASGMGRNAAAQLSLGNPDIDHAALARAMGVNGTRATTAGEFNAQLAAALASPGPHLIEAVI